MTNEIKEEKFEKYTKIPVTIEAYQTDEELKIETLEGTMKANKGDWIIKGVKGEFYPCKADVFDMTYVKDDDEMTKNVNEMERFRCRILSDKQVVNLLNEQYSKINELEERIAVFEQKEQNKEKDELRWALNQFRYNEKTEKEHKAFSILERALFKKTPLR